MKCVLSGVEQMLLYLGLHEVEPAEAEDERRRLLNDETGRLERLLDRSRNPIAAALSINFSDTFSFEICRNANNF